MFGARPKLYVGRHCVRLARALGIGGGKNLEHFVARPVCNRVRDPAKFRKLFSLRSGYFLVWIKELGGWAEGVRRRRYRPQRDTLSEPRREREPIL